MILALLFYIIPIIIAGIIIYLSMDKGETIEDYLDDMDNPEILLMILAPIANYFILLLMILSLIYEVVKYYNK